MYPLNREHALQIVCAAAQCFVGHRRSGSHQPMGPLIVGGDGINPDKITVDEIERSMALLKTKEPSGWPEVVGPTPIDVGGADCYYEGPQPTFGRNCYGSNLPPPRIPRYGFFRRSGFYEEADERYHLPPRLYEPPRA